MKCHEKYFFVLSLFVFVVPSTFGRRSGGGSRSRSSGGSKSTSHHVTSHSYPKQTYSPSSGTSHTYGSGNSYTNTGTGTSYGWRPNTAGNRYNSNTGTGHYYNSPSSTTNWGSSHSSPSYQQPQNAFGTFHPVSSGIAPSYHFHKSTSYVPIYIPSSHSYMHHHHRNYDQSSSSTATNNYTPPPPPSEPVVYKEDSFGPTSDTPLIVGFNNMIVYGVYENDKHYVITISEDLDENMDEIPERFLHTEESSLFDIVTLKPTTTTTMEPSTSEASEESNTEWNGTVAALKILSSNKEAHNEDDSRPIGANVPIDGNVHGDVLNLHFGDVIP